MKSHISILFFLALLGSTSAQLLPNLGGQRTGSSTLTFLKNDANPRSLGMASANITLKEDGFAPFMNPASSASIEGLNFSTSNYLHGAGIHQTFFASTLPLNSSGSALSLTINNLSSGRQEVRTEFQPEGTGEYFYVVNTAVGLGYAKELSDQFSFGIQLKYIRESLAQYRNHTVAADLGFLYNTDVKELSFAVVVSNFGGSTKLSGDHREVVFDPNNAVNSPESYPVPTVFKLGISLVPLDKNNHKLLTAVQLNHPNDNNENIRLGVEYGYRELIFLRAGYNLGRETFRYPTFGTGFRTQLGRQPLRVDYSFIPTHRMGTQHSIGFSLTIVKPQDRSVE